MNVIKKWIVTAVQNAATSYYRIKMNYSYLILWYKFNWYSLIVITSIQNTLNLLNIQWARSLFLILNWGKHVSKIFYIN